jgi:hypothetical protein
MCISGPVSRLSQKKLEAHAKTVIAAVNALSYELAGSVTGRPPGGFRLGILKRSQCADAA